MNVGCIATESLAKCGQTEARHTARNSPEKIGKKTLMNQDQLDMLVFKLNSHVTEGQGSPFERFFGRNVGTYQPQLFRRKIDHARMIARRSEAQMKIANRLGRRSKDEFHVGDEVLVQDMKTLKWTIKGTVMEARTAEDGTTRSFFIRTEMGRSTLRNARHMKFQQLSPRRVTFADADSHEADDSDSNDDDTTAEGGTGTAETATTTPRASARLAARNERQP